MSNSSSDSRLRKRLTNGGTPVTFYEDDGTGQFVERTFFASDFSDRDVTELDEWVRTQYIRTARQSLTPDMDEADRKETIGIALEAAAGLTWTSPRGIRMVNTPAGWTQITWRFLRRNHPEITIDRVQSLLLNPQNRQEAEQVLERINESNNEVATASQKKTRGKARSRR
jgi:hypothetical protein